MQFRFHNYPILGANKAKETTKDATDATVKKGSEAKEAVKSDAKNGGKKSKESAGHAKDSAVKKTVKWDARVWWETARKSYFPLG